ncbi:unnamed protein product [Kuraishia capsulata CBS 1993]|uniref:Transcription elongation factor n=1 Tax=Kuraishia capsulata CBS 1993 TaxID=1382522 RepID=W6MR36_9ASCO|nr:uncharacterized protein KUCA_T00003686001 [Kuraishia capsulata CBS 1993]CDK27707.1 unnamed protein product [Kuraishia capsulata CBS 1993]
MDAKTIRSSMADLDKTKDTKVILEILTSLKRDVRPTEKLLRETKVGVAVNKLRSHADPEISNLVKKIIKSWKDEVSSEKKSKVVKKEEPTASSASSASPAIKGEKFQTSKARNPQNDGVSINIHENTTRNGSVGGLYTALAIDSDAFPKIILQTAKEIEQAAYELEYLTVNDNYRNKMRSLIMNLRNKQNPELRARVLSGNIFPAEFVRMKAEDLAPEALKKEIKRLHQKNLHDARGAVEERATTDRFTCGKCKQKKVSYYQMQTRSADEPLTTFCTCENCGNRWKFC